MIHPYTKIQYLDIKDGEPRYTTLAGLYREYCHIVNAIYTDNERIKEIDFTNNPHVKITDLYGWTDVLKVTKIQIKSDQFVWNNISAMNKNVFVDDNELIPCYDINDQHNTFHGEIKYSYTLKNVSKINNHDYIRLHNVEDDHGNRTEFSKPSVNISVKTESGLITGFNIVTKSRFFNAGNIQLFAADDITMDELFRWYK